MPFSAASLLTPYAITDGSIQQALRRELYMFALYRTLEAALLALVVFSPFGDMAGPPRDLLLARSVAFAYLPMAVVLLLASRRDGSALGWQALIGVGVDIALAALITHALPDAGPGVAMMLLFNVGAAALFVPLTAAMAIAAAAAAALAGEYIWTSLGSLPFERPLAEVLMFSVSFFAMVTVSNLLGRQMRDSLQRADARTAEATNL
ncbi:MAG: PAS domain-containing sensor histidine kinase, partial [Luteimonas sp.]